VHRPDGIEEASHCVLVVRNWAGRRDTEAPRHRGAETQTDTNGFEQSESFRQGRRSDLHYKHGFTDIAAD